MTNVNIVGHLVIFKLSYIGYFYRLKDKDLRFWLPPPRWFNTYPPAFVVHAVIDVIVTMAKIIFCGEIFDKGSLTCQEKNFRYREGDWLSRFLPYTSTKWYPNNQYSKAFIFFSPISQNCQRFSFSVSLFELRSFMFNHFYCWTVLILFCWFLANTKLD